MFKVYPDVYITKSIEVKMYGQPVCMNDDWIICNTFALRHCSYAVRRVKPKAPIIVERGLTPHQVQWLDGDILIYNNTRDLWRCDLRTGKCMVIMQYKISHIGTELPIVGYGKLIYSTALYEHSIQPRSLYSLCATTIRLSMKRDQYVKWLKIPRKFKLDVVKAYPLSNTVSLKGIRLKVDCAPIRVQLNNEYLVRIGWVVGHENIVVYDIANEEEWIEKFDPRNEWESRVHGHLLSEVLHKGTLYALSENWVTIYDLASRTFTKEVMNVSLTWWAPFRGLSSFIGF